MANKIPVIKVKSELKRIDNSSPYIKDVVALIGEFANDAHSGEFFVAKSLAEAETVFGSSTTSAGNKALKQIFQEDTISGCIIVNQTTAGQGASVTLPNALKAIKDVDFDILFVASNLSNDDFDDIADFCDERLEAKRPVTYVAVATRTSKATYETTIGKTGDSCLAVLTQGLTVNDIDLNLIESGAYLTNLIATSNVGNSLTAKKLEEVSDVDTVYDENSTPKLSELVGMGYFVVRETDPLNETFEVVNSANKDGVDMYITRVLAYVLNDFALRDYLGERSNEATLSGIKMECGRLLTKFRDDLKLVENITYSVQKKDSETAEVIINTIQFSGIITEIDVSIVYEVI